MKKLMVLGATILLSACAGGQLTPAGSAAIVTAAPAVQTLAGLAAANNKQIADVISQGQLFCQSGAGLVAVVGALSSPSSVIGQLDATVAKACPIINGVQTTPVPVSAIPVVVSAPAAALKPTS